MKETYFIFCALYGCGIKEALCRFLVRDLMLLACKQHLSCRYLAEKMQVHVCAGIKQLKNNCL